jgi:hypothetical protein
MCASGKRIQMALSISATILLVSFLSACSLSPTQEVVVVTATPTQTAVPTETPEPTATPTSTPTPIPTPDPWGDPDGDGYPTSFEEAWGTDPLAETSFEDL